MENEKKTIGIDQQIEAVQDMLPVIDNASKEVFEEVTKSLQFAKASIGYFDAMCHAFVDGELSFEKKMEIATKSGTELFPFVPEWGKDEIIRDIENPDFEGLFSALHGVGMEIRPVLGQPIGNLPDQDPDNAAITDEQKADIMAGIENGVRYIRKHNRFTSGVRRFGIDVMTEETYPDFKFMRCADENDRDEEYAEMLTSDEVTTKEYPEPVKKE